LNFSGKRPSIRILRREETMRVWSGLSAIGQQLLYVYMSTRLKWAHRRLEMSHEKDRYYNIFWVVLFFNRFLPTVNRRIYIVPVAPKSFVNLSINKNEHKPLETVVHPFTTTSQPIKTTLNQTTSFPPVST